MAVLRNVPKTFSFEEQRIEINAIAQDLYDLEASYTTYTGTTGTASSITVVNNTSSWQSGLLEYDPQTSVFTFTPPDLSGIPSSTKVAEWDEAHGWGDHSTEGYLTSLPSHTHDLQTLGDVSLSGGDAPSDGEALVWNQTAQKWKAGTVSSGWQGNVQNSTTVNGGGVISFDANTNTLIFQPADIFSGSYTDLTNKPTIVENINDLSDVDTTGVAQTKILRHNGTKWVVSEDVSYSQAILGGNTNAETSVQWDLTPTIDGGVGIADSITITGGTNITFSSVSVNGFTIDAATGSTVANINDLGDVDTTGAENGKILKHNGTSWVVADDEEGSGGTPATTITSLNDVGDVNVGTVITGGHVLKWDDQNDEWIAGPDLTSSGGSGIALTDISVVKPNPAASGSGDVTYNSTSGQFTYTPPDLSNAGGGIALTDISVVKPNPIASGSGDVTYDNTTGEFTYTPPSIPAAQVKSDWDVSGTLAEILNKPTKLSEFQNDLNLSIPTNIGDLSDVDTTGASNNKILKFNGTNWVVADDDVSTGGSGISLAQARQGLSVSPNMGGATANGGISYNDTTGVFTYSPQDISGFSPTNHTHSYNLNDLGDVTLGTVAEGKILKYTSGSWSAEDESAGGGSTTYNVVSTTEDGLAPQLPGSHGGKFLKADGSWEVPAYTQYSLADENGNGLMPQLQAVHNDHFLRADGQWAVAPGVGGEANVQADWTQTTTTSDDYIKNKPGAFGGTASGLVPASTSGETDKFLRSDGTWQDVSSGGASNLNDLGDVNTAGAADGKVLKYSSGNWIVGNDSSPTNASFNLSGLGDVDFSGLGSPGSGKILKHNGTSWAFDDEGGIPSGTIVMFNSSSPPSGWVLCNGSNGTPDLRDKFVIGAGSSYNQGSTGGYTDAIVVSHSHNTGTMSSHNGHTHGTGNYGTNNTGDHYHQLSSGISGSGTTGNQSNNHYHTTSTNISVGGGSHGHTVRCNSWDNGGNYSGPQNAWNGDTAYNYAESHGIIGGGSHNHTASFVAATLGISENHTHDFNFNVSGNTTNSSNGNHAHNITGSSDNDGSHNHNISITSQGNSGSGRNLPPYYAITFIMKT